MSVVATLPASSQAGTERQMFTTGTPAELELARSRGLEHLRSVAPLRGVDPSDLAVTDAHVDAQSMAHVRVRQSFRGIPVFGGEAIVHFRSNGELFAETNDLVPNVAVASTSPVVSRNGAETRARELRCADCVVVTPADLWVFRHENVDHLVYRVQLRRTTPPSLPIVFVDARSGDLVWEYDGLPTGSAAPGVSQIRKRL